MADERRILLVEGSDTYLRMLRTYFSREGFEVDTATNGAEALDAISARKPDVVVTAEWMPVMDGLQLIKQLRSSTATVAIPALLLTTNEEADTLEAGRSAGASDCIGRDAAIQRIGERVESLMATFVPTAPPPAARPSKLAHTVTVLSARGGSGKTVLASNLGVTLAQRGGETACLVDFNLEFGTAALTLNLRPTVSLREIAEGAIIEGSDREFDGLLLRHESGLRVVPAVSRPGDSEFISESALSRLLNRLRRLYDHVIIDGRPSFREFMLDIWEMSDSLVVPCPPEVVAVGVTRDLLDAFASVSIDPDKVLIVVNQIAPKSRLTPQQVERNLGSTIFTIPYGGDNFHRSLDLGRTYLTEFPKEPTAQAIRKLADLLMQRRAERQRQQATATAEAS